MRGARLSGSDSSILLNRDSQCFERPGESQIDMLHV
jgi:hypothetical protein